MPATCSVDAQFRVDSNLAKELAGQFGTPLYVLSEAGLRSRMRDYQAAFRKAYPDIELSYASKANGTLVVLKIAFEEGFNIDVASEGELRGAELAGIPASSCEFHGNNKSQRELEYALSRGVHTIISDNFEELDLLGELWQQQSKTRILLRLAPGVDPRTHKKISTGQEDSKFGFNISNGDAEKALLKALSLRLPVQGFHCHVGSQILDGQSQIEGAEILAAFARKMLEKHGFQCSVLNFGGGLGIRYTNSDAPIDLEIYCAALVRSASQKLEGSGLAPTFAQEPGRSLVGENGVTLYTVGVVKTVPTLTGEKTYLVVDGGLADNPRPVMYDGVFQLELMRDSKASTAHFSVSGRHCETDLLFEDVELPSDIKRGDLLQVLSTGAYNSSMASNYNRYQRPAAVLIRPDGSLSLVQKRESWDEVFSREQLPGDMA
jgi:diaminopimelate decarboxylase